MRDRGRRKKGKERRVKRGCGGERGMREEEEGSWYRRVVHIFT